MSCAARPNQLFVLGLEDVAVLEEIAEQRCEVFDLDRALHIGLGKADRAAPQRFADHREIVETQLCVQTRRRVAEQLGLAIGESDGHRAEARAADQAPAEIGGDS